ncbi:type II secretion system F family protein [uncultured Jatrophihabitans sp.]|uniref:type II secretion system F family protein n=1 Tax=uncultured Jatrophihabitans sp. TaxID=1610747 RepID=UPI0035CC77C3
MTVCWLALAATLILTASGGGTASARVAALSAGRRLAVGAGRPGARAGAWWRSSPSRSRPTAVGSAGACLALVGGIAWSAGPALGVASAAVAGAAWSVGRGLVRRHAAARTRAQLGSALQVLVAELAAGARPGEALRAAARASPAHEAVLDRAADGAESGAGAGQRLAEHPDLRPVAVAWQLSEQTGAALTGVLERVLADVGARDRTRRAVAVALAGPRSSALVLTGLPLVGVALGTTMDANPLRFLLDTPAGRLTCCAGVLLDVAGVLWMQRLLGSAERG